MPSHPARFLAALAVALLVGAPGKAALEIFHPDAGRPAMRDFRPTEYRGHPQIYDIAQSANGFIYLGNQEGMLEFDGSRWTHHRATTPLLFQLKAAADGGLWGGGFDELGRFNPEPDGSWRFESWRARLPEAARPWGRTIHVLTTPDSVYFTSARGLLRIRGGQTEFWPAPADNLRLTLHRFGPRVLLHVSGRGLFIPGDDGRLTPVSDAPVLRQPGRHLSAPLPDGRVFWCTSDGSYVTDASARDFRPFGGPVEDFLRRAGRINAVCVLRDGTLALASSAQGLALLSPDSHVLRVLDRSSGLADNAVLSLCEDQQGGLWVGLNSGVTRLALDRGITVFDATNGPTPGTIDSWGRHAGRLYAGTYDGLYRLEPPGATGHGAAFTRVNPRITNIFGLESYAGHLLVAASGGLYELDDTGQERLVVPMPANNPVALLPSRLHPGRFYLPGGAGLTVVQQEAAGWRVLGERRDLGDIHTAVLEEDGTLWLSSDSRGFWRVPGAEEIADWTGAVFEQYHTGQGLPAGIVWTTVTRGHAGSVFFTDKGPRRFDAARKAFVPEDRYVTAGQPPLLLTPTTVSGRDTWASAFSDSTLIATAPLCRFTSGPDGRMAMRIAPPEALRELGFGGAAVMWVDRTDGHDVLWARGYNNTVRINLARPEPATEPWPVHLRSLAAEGRRLAWPAAGGTVSVTYSREPITLTFAAPRFDALDGLRYQTRLLGFSDRWSEPAADATASYTNLEGGPFTFEVRASDATGATSETARLVFSVAPPWPRSRAAFAVYLLLAVLAVFAYVRWRLAAAQREQARLARLVAARTSELAVARDEAQAADRAKSTFLAHMSHELRTPLNGVIGYAQVLLNDGSLTDPQRERAQIVHASGTHLLRLINEVLDFSKIEAGHIERHDAPFHPEQLLRELATLHTAAAAARGLEFGTELPADLPEFVRGDPQKLRQVLDNLLSNAVKFTRTGRVDLAVASAGPGAWTFSVRDTGVGLSAEDLAGLFQPFAQAASRPAGEAGTGLGLVITRRLVQLLGGELQVESTPGRGSRFWFTLGLPAATPAGQASRPPFATDGYEGPARRVLIVDDNAVNRTLLTELLAPLGFLCTSHASAEEALAWLESAPSPDLAFLDVKLPGLDGLELTRRLRARPATAMMPIVLTSASVLTFDAAAAARAGSTDFLPKPFAGSQLVGLVSRLLGLTWRPATPQPAAAATAALAEHLAPGLRAAAEAGDITALRTGLRAARAAQPSASAFIDQLEKLAAAYQLERVRQLLRETRP